MSSLASVEKRSRYFSLSGEEVVGELKDKQEEADTVKKEEKRWSTYLDRLEPPLARMMARVIR
jgi:hypothetical protein